MNFKSLVFTAFKFGVVFNISTALVAMGYVVAVENYFKPFNISPRSIDFGTIATGGVMFNMQNFKDLETLPRWKKLSTNFDFFIPDTALRDDQRARKSPRVERWCKVHNCWAHRIGFTDMRRNDYKIFTIDDWFFRNKSYLNTPLEDVKVFPLDLFLKSLRPGSIVVINEPLTLFQQHPLNFKLFADWVIVLRRKHPHLKFKLGLQLHFQWLDSQWLRLQDGRLFAQFKKFSADYNIPWGISEFSIYDSVWRRRLFATYRSGRRTDGVTSAIESFVPHRLRRAFVLHMAYSIHKTVLQSGASYVVAWGNIPTLWFSEEIDKDYRSTFALFDWDGNPLSMYWAIARGLEDGKK